MTPVPLLRGCFVAFLAVGAAWGCQSPEAFHISGDGSLLNSMEGTGGDDGTGGDGGTGGTIASTGGTIGSGGQSSGGATAGSGGATTGSGGVAGSAQGGATSSGGKGGATTGSGGATGGSGAGGKGGSTSSGGKGGTPPGSGGTPPGSGGATGGSGTGSGGATGGGKGGSTATGGAGGKSGGVGGTVGTGPCAGLCADPVIFAGPSYSSQNLGTGATCHQTMSSLAGGNCSNFSSPRTFKVNDVTVACNGANWAPGAKRMGGYCLQASAGNQTYAAFTTY